MGASPTKTTGAGDDHPTLDPAFSSLLPYYLRDVKSNLTVATKTCDSVFLYNDYKFQHGVLHHLVTFQ